MNMCSTVAFGVSRGGASLPARNRKPEVTGEYPEFARLTLEITGLVPRSTAAYRSGVSHDTIAKMWRGERVGPNAITTFAMGYRVDPNPLLRAAGYPPIQVDKPEIEYVPDSDAIPVPEGYEDLDGPSRVAATSAAQDAFRAVADALRRARQVGTYGALRPDEHRLGDPESPEEFMQDEERGDAAVPVKE